MNVAVSGIIYCDLAVISRVVIWIDADRRTRSLLSVDDMVEGEQTFWTNCPSQVDLLSVRRGGSI